MRLSEQSTTDILAPGPLLLDIAQERGWTRDTADSWASGTMMRCEGQRRVHSSLKALNGDLGRRLWRAHVSVLFPEIEERRQEILQRVGRHLVIPWDTGSGVVTDARYLEISHIAYQLEGLRQRVPREDRVLVQNLKALRDRLAHLEPAPYGLIQSILSLRSEENEGAERGRLAD
jgi:hypothetical protein